jgi:hypothetical protein
MHPPFHSRGPPAASKQQVPGIVVAKRLLALLFRFSGQIGFALACGNLILCG